MIESINHIPPEACQTLKDTIQASIKMNTIKQIQLNQKLRKAESGKNRDKI